MSSLDALLDAWESMVDYLRTRDPSVPCPFRFPHLEQVSEDLGLPAVGEVVNSVNEPSLLKTEPALKNLDERTLTALQHGLHEDGDDPFVAAWSEKLLRVCEIRRRELRRRSRCPGETSRDARRKILRLCLYFLQHFQAHRDARYVNLVLKLVDQSWLGVRLPRGRWGRRPTIGGWDDVLVVLIHALLEHAMLTLRRTEVEVRNLGERQKPTSQLPSLPMESAFVGRASPRVIVFSPNPHSLYTVTILELLRVHGFTVQGVVLRKILNWRRLISEVRRDGPRLAWKIWRKLILRQHAYRPRPYQTLPDVMSELGVQSASVPEWARNAGVQVWRCTTLNDRAVQEALLECEPDAVVFSGGGLIREPILQASGVGVINTHLGVLPMYRGMDVVEWPILEGRPDDVGLSVHLMSSGVDEGDMLAKYRAAREHTDSIFDLRERLEALSPVACVSATVGLLKGEIRPCPQNPSDGRQYFIMHQRLHRLARLRYRQIRAEEVNRQAPRHRAPTE